MEGFLSYHGGEDRGSAILLDAEDLAERPQRGGAEGEDHVRPDRLDLGEKAIELGLVPGADPEFLSELRPAGDGLGLRGGERLEFVVPRPEVEHVCGVAVGVVDACMTKHGFEDATGRPDKRLSGTLLVFSPGFPDDHYIIAAGNVVHAVLGMASALVARYGFSSSFKKSRATRGSLS